MCHAPGLFAHGVLTTPLRGGSAEPRCPGEKAFLSQSKANMETEFYMEFLLSPDLWNPWHFFC